MVKSGQKGIAHALEMNELVECRAACDRYSEWNFATSCVGLSPHSFELIVGLDIPLPTLD